MLTLHVLTFIDILQHRVFCFKCAIHILFNSTITVLTVYSSFCRKINVFSISVCVFL